MESQRVTRQGDGLTHDRACLDVATLGNEEDLQSGHLFEEHSVIKSDPFHVHDLVEERLEVEPFQDRLREDGCHFPTPLGVMPVVLGDLIDLFTSFLGSLPLFGSATFVV